MEGRLFDDGRVLLEMSADQAWFLETLPDRLRAFLKSPQSNERLAERLFPSAYQDPELDREYQRLLGDDLARRKLECVDGFERTLARTRTTGELTQLVLSGEEYEFWLGFINDFRLMLGVELDIREDDWGEIPDDGRAGDFIILHYLTHLQEELLQAGEYELPRIDLADLEADDGQDDDTIA